MVEVIETYDDGDLPQIWDELRDGRKRHGCFLQGRAFRWSRTIGTRQHSFTRSGVPTIP